MTRFEVTIELNEIGSVFLENLSNAHVWLAISELQVAVDNG